MKPAANLAAEFDEYADRYDESLAQGLSISGENQDYFAKGRVAWLMKRHQDVAPLPRTIMDFGCGTGATTARLAEQLNAQSIIGVDASPKTLDRARQRYGDERLIFLLRDHYQPAENIDLAFCSGVFHHIELALRPAALRYIYRSLRPGGVFAFWENNPWNPGTRYVMSRIPFDRNASTITAPVARRLLISAGFKVIHIDFLFIFPRILKWMRGLEPSLCGIPFGAQYQILARKPHIPDVTS